MDDSNRETGLATGLRITYGIIAGILLIVFTANVALFFTVFNKNFWSGLMYSDEMRELIKDESDFSIEEIILENNPGVDLDLDDDEEITVAYIELAIDDYLELIFEGDTKPNEDRFEEFFDDYGDELYESLPTGSMTRREFEDSIMDDFEGYLEEYHDRFEDTDVYTVMEGLNKYGRSNTICMAVVGIILAAGFAVLLVIHKNKFRPVRAFGISLTVAEALSLPIWGLFALAFHAAGQEAEGDEAVVEFLVESFSNCILHVVLFEVAALILGIVLIVAGAVGASRKAREIEV